MSEIVKIFAQYEGSGYFMVLYTAAFIYLFITEKDRLLRAVFLYLPLIVWILFFLPPFHALYSKIEGSETYYRMLWMIPVTFTILYAGVHLFRRRILTGTAALALVLILCGNYVYNNANILKAENRLHLPQLVLDICDCITNDSGGEKVMVAMPANVVQFVRQYDSRIMMPYGREMLMPQWSNVTNDVYEQIEAEVIDAEGMAAAADQYSCEYIVLEADKEVDGDLADYGYEKIQTVDGYDIYRNTNEEDSPAA